MAVFYYDRIPKPIVVRPSGIWNSRAPFHNFLMIHKSHMRMYLISVLCNEKYYSDYKKARSEGITLEEFLVAPNRNRSQRAWRYYIKSQTERYADGRIKPPIYSNTANDLVVALEQLKKSEVILQFTLFEQYLRCWLLNYLLIRLENKQQLSDTEDDLCYLLSPFLKPTKKKKRIPNIMDEIPSIKNTLMSLDHNGDLMNYKQSYTCFDAVTFWRLYRNALVHNRGFCTPRLYENQFAFWNDCMKQFSKKDKFIERSSLSLSDELLRHCTSVIYKAAQALEGVLFIESNQRRGHPWAPEPKPENVELFPEYVGPLLVNGDHEPSYTWSINSDFRETFKIITALPVTIDLPSV